MTIATRIAICGGILLSAIPAIAATPVAEVPLEVYRKTVAVRAVVSGHAGRFVLDTGGGLTLLTPAFAERIGARPWGRLTGHRMMGDRLDVPRVDDLEIVIGGLGLHAPVAGVLDLMKLFPEGAEPVDGLIALDLFDGRAITLDFPAGKLVVESAASLAERAAAGRELPLLLARELQGRALAVSVGVATARGTVWMELDSGNGGTILVSKPYAELLGLDPEVEGPQDAAFEVAPGVVARGTAFTPDMILDGNLGMPFLRDLVVTLDLAAGRLWIASQPVPVQAGSLTSSRRSGR